MTPIRCFVAADLPGEVADDLARLQARLRGVGVRARWTNPGSMHLTLKFLGELEPDRFDAACRALDAPAEIGGPLDLAAQGLGAFPSLSRARVLWVGIGGEAPRLARLALVVEARAEAAGVPREGRPFRPHLTLGRAPGAAPMAGLARAFAAEGGYEGPPFRVMALVLYESRLGPRGPTYDPRLTISLT